MNKVIILRGSGTPSNNAKMLNSCLLEFILGEG